MFRRFFGSVANSTVQQQPVAQDLKNSARKRLGSFLTPALDSERRERIRSCVSLRIGVSSVTWARLELAAPQRNAPCQLTHWQHHEVCEKKLHIHELVRRCLYVDYMIPTADCYIFESPQTAMTTSNPGSTEQQNINVQKAQISAMLSFAVAGRNHIEDVAASDVDPSSKVNQVYYMRRFLTARLFRHLVGTERVSSEETILRLMRTHYNIPEEQDYVLDDSQHTAMSNEQNESSASESESDMSLRVHVQFNDVQRNMFAHAERYHREFLGQALLLNLAFVRLALLQDPQSIAAVSRVSKKDKEESEELVRKKALKPLE